MDDASSMDEIVCLEPDGTPQFYALMPELRSRDLLHRSGFDPEAHAL
jgi:hypothetical protein